MGINIEKKLEGKSNLISRHKYIPITNKIAEMTNVISINGVLQIVSKNFALTEEKPVMYPNEFGGGYGFI